MGIYRLSKKQKEQVVSYFFEYICTEIENDPELTKEKYACIGVLAREEMPKWIDSLEEQLGEDIRKGAVTKEYLEKMDLGETLKNSVAELRYHKSRA